MTVPLERFTVRSARGFDREISQRISAGRLTALGRDRAFAGSRWPGFRG